MVIRAPLFAAIGNFDGVHRGHRFLIAETKRVAATAGAATGVVVFDPHPRRFFRPSDPPFLLTGAARRESLLKAEGVAEILPLAFDAALAATSPESFVRDVLKARLGLAGVVTGADFRFGKGRAGDAQSLQLLAAEAGMASHIVEPVGDGAEKFGSSAIRAALAQGDVSGAASMLGRPWAVDGVVARGRQLGRTIGFATANFELGDLVEPRRGVYAVRATVAGRAYDAVANFGRRPTVGATAPLLETHIFDFSGDLYGQTIDVAFIDFIRDEMKFDSVDALKVQIAKDSEEARRRLAVRA